MFKAATFLNYQENLLNLIYSPTNLQTTTWSVKTGLKPANPTSKRTQTLIYSLFVMI